MTAGKGRVFLSVDMSESRFWMETRGRTAAAEAISGGEERERGEKGG